MGLQDIVKEIKRELPPFNNALIRDLREQEIEGLTDFIAERLYECCEVIDPLLKLTDFQVLSPSERLLFELRAPHQTNMVNIRDDEAVLVAYNFQYCDIKFTKHLYVPSYCYEDSSIIVGGTRYECQLTMVEKLFSTNARHNGVTIKVIRSPISFWKNTLHKYQDVVGGKQFIGSIVSCQIHWKQPPKTTRKIKPSIIHYLLCKFELIEVLAMFGIPIDAATFVVTDQYEDEFYYFKAQDRAIQKNPVLLKVKKELMEADRNLQDIVTSIVYLMSPTRSPISMNYLQNASTDLFKILLGKIIHGPNTDIHQSLNYMQRHIQSVDTYLDNYTRNIFAASGIQIASIYDLLVFVSMNINKIVVNNPNNNMFNKRLETIRSVVIEGMFKYLYKQIYKYERKRDKKYMEEVVANILRISPTFIISSLSKSESTRFNPSIQTDNWLLTIASKAVKKLSAIKSSGTKKTSGGLIDSPVNRFHPSMMICESAIGFSHTNPGSSFIINPYAEIDETGGFIKTEKHQEFEKQINDLLPR